MIPTDSDDWLRAEFRVACALCDWRVASTVSRFAIVENRLLEIGLLEENFLRLQYEQHFMEEHFTPATVERRNVGWPEA